MMEISTEAETLPKSITIWLIWRYSEEHVISMHGRAVQGEEKKNFAQARHGRDCLACA